jgi:hypothetical protein
LLVYARRRFRPWYLVFLGAVVIASTVAATAPAAPGPLVVALAADTGLCGSTGVLTNATSCTYTTIRSDTFTVLAGVDSVVVDVVGAQSGRYFIAGDAAVVSFRFLGRLTQGPAVRATDRRHSLRLDVLTMT